MDYVYNSYINYVNYNYINKKKDEINSSYFNEIINKTIQNFNADKNKILSKNTIIILDPHLNIEKSGVSFFLENIMLFFYSYLHNYFDNILYIKFDQFKDIQNSKEKFRNNIANLFNPFINFKDRLIFFDSDIHYSGLYLDKNFNKITLLHGSPLISFKKNNLFLPKNLQNKCKINEINNINSSNFIVSPSKHHIENITDIFEYNIKQNINIVPNYIHDNNVNIIDKTIKYDILYIHQFKYLKHETIIEKLIKNNKQINFLYLSNDNLNINYKNVSLFIDNKQRNRDINIKIHKYLLSCFILIEPLIYPNFSYSILKAINYKCFLILNKNSKNCLELIENFPYIKDYVFFIDFKNPEYCYEVSSYYNKCKKMFQNDTFKKNMNENYNKFMYDVFVKNFDFYNNLFSKIFKINTYNKIKSDVSNIIYGKKLRNSNMLSKHNSCIFIVNDNFISKNNINLRYRNNILNYKYNILENNIISLPESSLETYFYLFQQNIIKINQHGVYEFTNKDQFLYLKKLLYSHNHKITYNSIINKLFF